MNEPVLTKRIKLTRGLWALVDAKDYANLTRHKWHAAQGSKTFYAHRTVRQADGTKRTVRMHREIMGLVESDDILCDHRNGNGLDNLRNNLRIATKSQNAQNANSSNSKKIGGYKGVGWHTRFEKWEAYIRAPSPTGGRGRKKFLGRFDNPEDAARAYDKAALKYFGEFAKMNFQPQAAE